jgi:hypothetical protein
MDLPSLLNLPLRMTGAGGAWLGAEEGWSDGWVKGWVEGCAEGRDDGWLVG